MAGYATDIIAISAGVKTAVDAITAANGYDVAIATSTSDLWQSPFDRSQREYPRAYIYLTPDEGNLVEQLDTSSFFVMTRISVDVWVHCQDQTDQDNLPKYAAAVLYAVNTYAMGASYDVRPEMISYHHLEKRKSVVRVVFATGVRFLGTDR